MDNDSVVINIEGNPEAPLLGRAVSSRTPFSQNDNSFIRLPARVASAVWENLFATFVLLLIVIWSTFLCLVVFFNTQLSTGVCMVLVLGIFFICTLGFSSGGGTSLHDDQDRRFRPLEIPVIKPHDLFQGSKTCGVNDIDAKPTTRDGFSVAVM